MSMFFNPETYRALMGWGMGLEWCEWQFHRFLPIVRWRLEGDKKWKYDKAEGWAHESEKL